MSEATPYVVLHQQYADGIWREYKRLFAIIGDGAIESALRESGDEPTGVYVAIPAASFDPRVVSTEQRTHFAMRAAR